MPNTFNFNEILSIQASGRLLDAFGPQTDFPYLAFDLSKSDNRIDDWLQSRPCPVIGIGDGAAAKACDVVLKAADKLSTIADNIRAAPLASMTLVQHLRAIEGLPLATALTIESLAYASVQQGPEFMTWLNGYGGGSLEPESGPPILTEISDDTLSIRLNRPKNYNAIGVEMRDALCEVLDMAIVHGGFETINLTGSGKNLFHRRGHSGIRRSHRPCHGSLGPDFAIAGNAVGGACRQTLHSCQRRSHWCRRGNLRLCQARDRNAESLVSTSRAEIWPHPWRRRHGSLCLTGSAASAQPIWLYLWKKCLRKQPWNGAWWTRLFEQYVSCSNCYLARHSCI